MKQVQAENEAKPSKIKRILGIIVNVLFVIFFLLCLVGLFLSITAKQNSDGAMELFGYEMRLVVSPSMEKCDETDVSGYEIKDIPVNSLVFIETVPEDEEESRDWYAALKVGDVLTFRYVYTTQETITHRIVEIEANENGGYTIVLEGDNKNSETGALQQVIDTSQTDSPNYVIGKVTGKSVALGYLITAVQSPWGLIFIVIIPCLIIIVIEIIRIAGVLSQKKKEAAKAEQQKKDEEIEELKRRLAAVESVANEGSQTAAGNVPAEGENQTGEGGAEK